MKFCFLMIGPMDENLDNVVSVLVPSTGASFTVNLSYMGRLFRGGEFSDKRRAKLTEQTMKQDW